MKKILTTLSVFALLCAMVSCGGKTSSASTSSASTPMSSVVTPVNEVTMTLTGDKEEIQVGEKLQLTPHISNSTETEVIYSSSKSEVATVDDSGLVTAKGVGETIITAKLKSNDKVEAKYALRVNERQPDSLKITGYETTEVYSGSTLDLNVTILPEIANQNHHWMSSDEEIATVSAEGKVIFYKGGSVTISVVSEADQTKKDEVIFTVQDNQSVLTLDRIATEKVLTDTYEDKVISYCGRTINVTGAKKFENGFAALNQNGTVGFDVGAYSVKSILVHFEGNLKMDYGFRFTSEREETLQSGVQSDVIGNHFILTASEETNITSIQIEYGETHEGILSSFWGNESYDLSQMATSENPVVTTNPDNFQNAIFNNIKGKYYVTETRIDLPYKTGNWNGFALGHLNSENGKTFRGLLVDANRQAIVTPTVDNADVLWGDETDRSQIWGQHNVGQFDYTNIKLTTIRNNTEFYYFINDELYWKDTGGTALDAVDTYPAMHYRSCDVTITDLSILVGQNKVENYIATHQESNRKLYSTNEANVEIRDNDTTIQFKNAYPEDPSNKAPINIKDNAAKSIGDAMLLKGDKNYDIEFDMTIDAWGDTDGTPIVGVTVKRRTLGPNEARSWEFGENKAGFAGWNYNGDIPNAIGSGGVNYTSPIEDGETVHVVLHKLLVDGGCDFSFECKGADHNWNWNGGYAGDLILEFGTRNADATLKNIQIIEK